jgi:hypothetical protein
VSDPVAELKRELVAAAARQQTRSNGPRLVLAVAAVVIAAAAALFITAPWTSSPGFLARAEAALTPPDGTILHLKWELTSIATDPACTVERGPSEVWIDQTPPHRYRAILGTLPPLDAGADPRTLVCERWQPYEIGGTLGSGNTLRFEPPSTLRVLPGAFSFPVDPVEDLRASIRAGTAHDEGTATFDGRTVERVRVDGDPGRFEWYVDPGTFHPVAAAGDGALGPPGQDVVPLRVVVRYLDYEYLPRTAANADLADIRAQHPDAATKG